MTNLPRISGVYADLRQVKSRGVWQVLIEVPSEAAEKLVETFGLPRQDEPTWLAVARLMKPPGASIPESAAIAGADAGGASPQKTAPAAPGGPKPQRTLAQYVGMRCNDTRFQKWIADQECTEVEQVDEAFAATWVREKCDVHTRADIKPGSLAEVAWRRIETQFLESTGQMAEAR